MQYRSYLFSLRESIYHLQKLVVNSQEIFLNNILTIFKV